MPEEIEVPTEELHEKMEEAAEEGGDSRKWISRVALSSALLAVLAAITALLAGHHANEAILEAMEASNQWSYYQAKGIKSDVIKIDARIDARIDALSTALGKPMEKTDVAAKDDEQIKRYGDEQKDIFNEGNELKKSSAEHMERHTKISWAVTSFQVAIAMGAIAVLSRRPKLWLLSVGLGLLGLFFFILGLL